MVTSYTSCEVLYRDKLCCRGLYKGTYAKCLAFVRSQAENLTDWSIYRAYLNGKPFHNATDEAFLLDHDSRYWRNRKL